MAQIPDHFGVLRGILNDYQLAISGPDVDRGITAVRSLEEQLESATAERDRLREALTWCNDHRDSERFHSVAESALNYRVQFPASRPGCARCGANASDIKWRDGIVCSECAPVDSPASRQESA